MMISVSLFFFGTTNVNYTFIDFFIVLKLALRYKKAKHVFTDFFA